ncbi:MAG: hypothetical protein QOI63_1972 [Thermoplasmata archaeon]|jgi:hypothetical protein|nr:hypothetical protein [Thermoplasmata archaeon]
MTRDAERGPAVGAKETGQQGLTRRETKPATDAVASGPATATPGVPVAPVPSLQVVDLRDCKAAARRLFPPGNPLREAICKEPDFLLLADAAVKLPVYVQWTLSQPAN